MVLQFSFCVRNVDAGTQDPGNWMQCDVCAAWGEGRGRGRGKEGKRNPAQKPPFSSMILVYGSQFHPWKLTSLQKMFWNVQFSQQLQAWNHQVVTIKNIIREHSHETPFMYGMWRLVYCCFKQKIFMLENSICLDWSFILQPSFFNHSDEFVNRKIADSISVVYDKTV